MLSWTALPARLRDWWHTQMHTSPLTLAVPFILILMLSAWLVGAGIALVSGTMHDQPLRLVALASIPALWAAIRASLATRGHGPLAVWAAIVADCGLAISGYALLDGPRGPFDPIPYLVPFLIAMRLAPRPAVAATILYVAAAIPISIPLWDRPPVVAALNLLQNFAIVSPLIFLMAALDRSWRRAAASRDTALAQATAAQQRQRFLAEASQVLATSLDYETTLTAVAHLALPTLADGCIVDLVEHETVRTVAIAHVDPVLEQRLRILRGAYQPDLNWTDYPLVVALRTGQPITVSEVTEAGVASVARDSSHLEQLRAVVGTSLLVVPLEARGRRLGALTFITSDAGRRPGSDDHDLAVGLAARAALAIDNGRLYAESQAALAAMRQSQAQLVQAGKLAAVGTLAAGVAHELNQPLMVIRGQAQLLLAKSDDPHQRAEKLRRIERQTGKMGAIIDHLRVFGRDDSDGPARPVSLNRAVEDALLLLGAQLRESAVAIRLELAHPEPVALAAANQVEQIVLNLLTNAQHAVAQRAMAPAERTVVVRTSQAGERCTLEVVDSGAGIPSAVLARLFEPFYTTKPVGQGTGLGLSISRDIARRWGGDLTLQNRTDDLGAIGVLALPAAPAAAVVAAD
jgi:C4-dicarboxylate-specific signal transduction histidine kinase